MEVEVQKNFKQPPLSYWMASTTQTGYPALNEDLKIDVAIIGGGITGIACAYMLNKRGVKTAQKGPM
jgi:glycine/D-amino acid oxidase-like deaminating enzyme